MPRDRWIATNPGDGEPRVPLTSGGWSDSFAPDEPALVDEAKNFQRMIEG
ncbi:MAG: hypothetical protein WD766_00045 [Gemmatimonadota bacterium]